MRKKNIMYITVEIDGRTLTRMYDISADANFGKDIDEIRTNILEPYPKEWDEGEMSPRGEE